MNAILLQCCAGAAKIVKCGCDIEAATNGGDVEIVKSICCAIVSITAIVVLGSLLWRFMDHIANKNNAKRKRCWDVEDKIHKQKSDLIGKLLDFKKERAYPYDKDKDGKPQKRGYDDQVSEGYETIIGYLLSIAGDSTKPINLESFKQNLGIKTKDDGQSVPTNPYTESTTKD